MRRRTDRLNALRTVARRTVAGPTIEAIESRVLLSGAGDPDPTFAGDGTITVGFGGSERLYAIETLPGGKILAAGTSNGRLALAQFRADGTLDKSFDYDGKVISAVPIVPDDVQRLADGKILVSGGGAVARFNADGSLDTPYGGGDGEIRLSFPRPDGDSSTLLTTALQPDGKIIAVGYVSTFRNNGSEFDQVDDDSLVARYRPDGTLDPSFGNGAGYTRLSSDTSNTELLLVTVTPTGDIVAVGLDHGDPRENRVREVFQRYASDGTLKFGAAISPPTVSRADLRTLAAAPDGTAVVVEGQDNDVESNYTVLKPTLPAGATPGTVFPQDFVAAAGFASDSHVVFAGPIAGGFRVDRRDPIDGFGGGDGSVDVTFGGTAPGSPKVVTVDADGRIIVAGTIGGDFAVARLLGDATTQPPGGGGDFSQTYQAEDAKVANGASPTRATTGGSTGTGFVDYGDRLGEYVEFTVDVPAAGTYDLDFRYANGSFAARGLNLSVNGASSGSVSFAPTGGWSAWKVLTKSAQLKAGANTVRLTTTGQSGPNLDALTVRSTTVEQPPTEPPPTDGVYQAESATLAGAVEASNNPGYAGTGFADYVNASGDYVEFAVDVSTAGSYDLTFRFANGSSAARSMQMRVNNVTQTLSFPLTGGWDEWRTVAISATLNAGRNTIRLTATGQSGPNLDSLTVRPNGVLSFHAEDATRQGAVVAREFTGYEGTGYAQYVNNGDYVEFVVNITDSERLYLTPRYANGSGQTQYLDLAVDGDNYGQLAFAPTGSWSAWSDAGASHPRFGLTAGTHRIRLTGNGPGTGPHLDSITLNPAPSFYVEAERAARADDPVVSTAAPGYTGSGFLDFINPSGASATWGFAERDLDDSRAFVVQFRYANGGATARSMRLSAVFNGEEQVQIDRLSFAPTGSWSNWRTLAVKVFLTPGSPDLPNGLRLTSIGESGPNLDWVKVL